MDPVAALHSETRAEPGRPLLTWYGPRAERVELSVITFANGVAKTAWFLRDELMLDPGDRVELRLGLHWQTPVWIAACAAIGAHLHVGPIAPESGACETTVSFDPASIADSLAENKVVVSRHPLGLPGPPLTGPFFDHARAAMAQPDTFEVDPADSAQFRLSGDPTGGELDLERITESADRAARRWGVKPGDTVLSSIPADLIDGWLAAWAIPLGTHSHTIWCVPEVDIATVARSERVTATIR